MSQNDKPTPNNVIRIPCTLDGKFFRHWFEFLSPYHNLTKREIDVAVAILQHRFKLSKVITDQELLDKILMNEDTKRTIREELGLSLAHFQIILTKLKKVNVIVDNKVNPKFIPKIREGEKYFQLLLLFDLNEVS